MIDLEFVLRVMRATAFNRCDDIWWRTDGRYAPVTFLVKCNDLFYWGTAEAEPLTPENIHLYEQAVRDLNAVPNPPYGTSYYADLYASSLFCCLARKMRPQGCCYPEERDLWPLFDACGPEREVNASNPYRPGQREAKIKAKGRDAFTDQRRLNWLESLMEPAEGYVEVYLAGLRNGCRNGVSGDWRACAYQVELQDKTPVTGTSLREAIDEAMLRQEGQP